MTIRCTGAFEIEPPGLAILETIPPIDGALPRDATINGLRRPFGKRVEPFFEIDSQDECSATRLHDAKATGSNFFVQTRPAEPSRGDHFADSIGKLLCVHLASLFRVRIIMRVFDFYSDGRGNQIESSLLYSGI